jgi:catechol 2,3-dioxygenase-like lactoylglutathione lyase family enzyme
VRVDHVIFGVADLDAARQRFADEFGLHAQFGGEHPQLGTRNCLVPVGASQYLELMAVADPASAHPLPRFLTGRIGPGDRAVAVCLAPDDLDTVASRLSLAIVAGERHTPGGDVVRWRMAGLEAALGPERLPFFIDWTGGGPGLDPSLNQDCQGIAWLEVGNELTRLGKWVGEDAALPIRWVDDESGPVAIGVRRGDKVIVVR